ncbi:S-layer homology domain-containing protein [Paenibacillus septentrionalis]|uniref:S-layer homology domain-containing protein n=1 Tax=Paenibacillus septentrionalis TaxID=429342 RepID=A0ABW1VAL8_9BACL
MKKLFSIFMTLALIVTLIPVYGPATQVEAAGSYFLFPNEKDSKASARIVANKFVNLTGTINGVVGSSISYKVEQITSNSDTPLNSTQDISTGITTTGDNQITVSNVELFAGLNKITFKGVAGTSTVEESIYIEFRDSPMLNDLKILFENRSYDVLENGVTMLYSQSQTQTPTGIITMDGYAPNATKVTVEINNYSYDFNVSQTSGTFRFTTSQLTINKGMNTIKFKVTNGGQVIETTRQVTLYNGEVTYYDEKLVNGTTTYDLSYNGDYSVNMNNGLKLEGKAIIPLPLYDIANSGTTPVDTSDMTAFTQALQRNMSISITGQATNPAVSIDSLNPQTLTSSTQYVTVGYSYTLPTTLAMNTPISFRMQAPNATQYDTSDTRQFILRDGTKAYIADINYLSGYDATVNTAARIKALQATDIPAAGVEVYSMPMAVELLIANYGQLGAINNSNSITDQLEVTINGVNYSYKVISESDGTPITEVVTRTVDGVDVSYLRVFLEFSNMDRSGTNTFGFKLTSSNAVTDVKTAIFKLQYGPYVKFENLVNGMSVNFDSYKDDNEALVRRIGALTGRIMNIANNNDIVYPTSTTEKQTVFLYLNNVEVPIQAYNYHADNNPNSKSPLFTPKGVTINNSGQIQSVTTTFSDWITSIMNKAGENTVKFVFRSSSYSYENTIKFNVVPTNLPSVPALNTDGVYPYTAGNWPPTASDSNFTANAGVYTTRQAEFNVYGTFDFIDLGFNETQINNALTQLGSSKDNYIVQIANPNWNTTVEWNLSKQFKVVDRLRNVEKTNTGAERVYNSGASDASTPDANITFYYDKDAQNFFFNITNQQMPEDGSPLVYVITVFNTGVSGPRATYRLEINPISIPYTIKSPVMEERITNQNFVEVIIASPGAESITIGKQTMEPVDYLDYSTGTATTTKAFRAVVNDLRANRDTKISFTIKRGDTTTTDSFTVKYVPTNIPGAQYLETMKSSHKVFNNALTLTFPKNTNLIRPKYNESANYATQVYNGHDILFAIANPDDGIVNRHMFESQPPDYSANSQATGELHIKTRFESYANRFIKASPLFWIDAGLADDPDISSPQYDPITSGLDPFPFPNIAGKYTGNFASRYGLIDRELVPSNVGSLTIAYDPSIVQSASTTITVFRFDPYASTWENVGGVVDEKKGTITVPFSKFGYYVAVKLTRSYNDIIDHSYAREAMEAIYSKGVMNASEPVNRFGGDEYITRGEFTRMIVRALDLPLNYAGSLHFTYYPETITNASNANAIYDYRYIETAARAGIVNGTRPGFFGEDVSITRQDAAVILARALELKLETSSTKAKQQLDKAFLDGASFDFYAIPAVLAIQKQGFIQGKPINSADPKAGNIFDPKARMLRSDAAIIMARVMNKLKKLPAIYN